MQLQQRSGPSMHALPSRGCWGRMADAVACLWPISSHRSLPAQLVGDTALVAITSCVWFGKKEGIVLLVGRLGLGSR